MINVLEVREHTLLEEFSEESCEGCQGQGGFLEEVIVINSFAFIHSEPTLCQAWC